MSRTDAKSGATRSGGGSGVTTFGIGIVTLDLLHSSTYIPAQLNACAIRFLKFGYQQPSHAFQGGRNVFDKLRQIAVECEEQDYDSFWIMDHLIQIPLAGKISEPILEPYTALSGIAASTNTIKLGTLCTCNLFRNPALLAKMGSTLDHVSNGRFWLGLGAGWFEEEAKMYGYGFPNAKKRLGMLEESLQIVKKSWTQSKTTFHGRYYDVADLILEPKPLQKPHPPILIGGGGEKITLKLVAKYGDACNLFPKGEALEQKLNALKMHCKSVGRDYGSILKTKLATVFFGASGEDALSKALEYKPRGMKTESFTSSMILGRPSDVIREIEDLGEAGIQYLIINFRGKYDPQDKKRFAEIARSF